MRSPSPETPSSPTDTTAARPFACPVPSCARRFKRRFTLKEHVKTHTGEKAFTCPVPSCHKSFTTSGNLSRHKRLHPWLETTFECLVAGCNCTFASETKLERHVRMAHFDHSTHLCPHANCGGAFSTAGNLKRHLRHHHPHAKLTEIVAVQPPAIESPVAVDRFGAVGASRGYMHAWAAEPLPRLAPATATVWPSLSSDCDLLEALGCLFEAEAAV